MSEPAPTEGLRLLALDGGGIRGLSSLQVLWNLMREIQLSEHLDKMPLPCECFDLIGGTSTGGIIALMLGRLRMSVDDALHMYAQLSKDVFSDEKFFGDRAFKASNLEAAIKKVISAQPAAMHDPEARMSDDDSSGVFCRTFVCVTVPNTLGAPTPVLFRTYEPRRGSFINCKIWEAARATSAAPTFFKPIEIDNGFGVRSRYTDGGIGHNNPAIVVLHEASSIFPERKIACMISIGTGKLKVSSLDKPSFIQRIMPRIDVAVAVAKIVTDCERIAEDMEHRFHDSPGIYFRFNVDQGMDDIKLGDWKKLDVVNDVSAMYLRSTTVSKTMADAAASVQARRGVVPTVQASGALASAVAHSKPIANRKLCPPSTPYFTGRESILERMTVYFSGKSGRRRIFVVHGLGGSGKSEISRRFVEIAQSSQPERFTEVFYVDASSEESIETDMASIAVEKGAGDSAADTLRWMEGHGDWLLVLDSADDPSLNLSDFIPQNAHGNTIITSRNAQTSEYGRASGSYCEIVRMTHEEAKTLFLWRAGLIKTKDETVRLSDHEDGIVETILKELGYFALAIIQASAYIASNPICGLDQYLELFRKQHRKLLEEYKDRVQRLDSYDGTVYTTWNISFKRLLRQNPLAATFLRVCAFLHHESISESIFRNAAAELFIFEDSIPPSEVILSWVTEFLHKFMTIEENTWDDSTFLRVVQDLCSYSLMSTSGESNLSVHLLVQDWTRDYDSNTVTPSYASFILGLSISHSYGHDGMSGYNNDLRRLLLHVQEVQCHDNHLAIYTAGWFGRLYLDNGKYKNAGIMWKMVMDARTFALGKEHPHTLISMGNLASTYWNQGRWADAEKLQVTVLEVKKRVLGEEHPSTLISMGNLALTYQNQGRWADAEKLEVTVVEAKKRVLGEEHPSTLISMGNLALTYRNQGRWADAEKLEVTVLEVKKRVFGEEHPETLISMSNLASTYHNHGRLMDAQKLEVTVLEVKKRVLGEEHPSTLISMGNLAFTYWNQGLWADAEKLEVTVVEAKKRVLGEEHPSTLISMGNLASTYRNQGRWADAEKLQVTVLEAHKRVLGEEHPDTLISMGNLASIYRNQGLWVDAEKLGMTVLEVKKRVLGEEHPHTLISMSNLASTYQSQGRWTDAEKLQVTVVEASKRVIGEEHPDALSSMDNLITTYHKLGRLSDAERLEAEAREIRKRILVSKDRDV